MRRINPVTLKLYTIGLRGFQEQKLVMKDNQILNDLIRYDVMNILRGMVLAYIYD